MTNKAIEAARAAAAEWCASQPFPSKQAEAPMIASGEYDHHSLVQAFLRHGEAAISAYLTQLEADGFVMVPVEPSEAMLDAAKNETGYSSAFFKRASALEIYRAMIAASPQVKG